VRAAVEVTVDEVEAWVVVMATDDYDVALVAAGALDGEGIEVVMPSDPRHNLPMGTVAPMYARAIELRVAPEDADRAREIVAAHQGVPLPPGFAGDEVEQWLAERAARRQKKSLSGWTLALAAALAAAMIAGTLWVIVRQVV
jgi:hypothetical protein